MRFAVTAQDSHYRRHLAPIVGELETRGHVRDNQADWVLTAGRLDALRLGRKGKSPILVEHGAGQTYMLNGQRVDASGVDPDPNVKLYLGPNAGVVDFMRGQLPGAQCEVVGSPALEQLSGQMRPASERGLVVFATHWQSGLPVKEAQTSWPWSLPIAKALHEEYGDRFRMHAHPRIYSRVQSQSNRKRFHPTFADDWDLLAPDTTVLVCDNSTIIWEAATLGIPVVLIDPPAWRDAEHGLRFGDEAARFRRITDPAHAVDTVRRARLVDVSVFDIVSGATDRAADLIVHSVNRR